MEGLPEEKRSKATHHEKLRRMQGMLPTNAFMPMPVLPEVTFMNGRVEIVIPEKFSSEITAKGTVTRWQTGKQECLIAKVLTESAIGAILNFSYGAKLERSLEA
eukprot:scaffold23913_cov45-Prasinocladus_malaysianus.AAC.1